MNPPIDGMTKRPDGPAFMMPAWLSCVRAALSAEGALESFSRETGKTYRPPRNAIEAMIDQSTGHDKEFIAAFADWVTETVWGVERPPRRAPRPSARTRNVPAFLPS